MALGDFLSRIKTDLAPSKPFLFEVQFSMANVNQDAVRDLTLMCHTCSLPGWSIESQPNRVYGLNKEMPHGIQYPPVTCTAYVDHNLGVMEFFKGLKSQMIDDGVASSRLGSFSPYYKSSYAEKSVVDIKILDTGSEKVVVTYKLSNVFVKDVSSLNLNWGAVNQAQEVSFTLTYEYLDIDFNTPKYDKNSSGPQAEMDLISGATKDGFSNDIQTASDVAQTTDLSNTSYI